MLMGTPVLSSVVSTVLVAAPLCLCVTVALKQFGVIISISLSVSFFYALLMLVPLLSMFGPQGAKCSGHSGSVSWWRVPFCSRIGRATIVVSWCLAIMVCNSLYLYGWAH
jgi:predicted RND superfamily exporter protein